MGVLYGTQSAKVAAGQTVAPGFLAAGTRNTVETITLAAQATTDTIVVGTIPKGAVFLGGELTSTVSLGSSTVAIGYTGNTGKYRTAATFTAVDTPTPFGNAAAIGVAETADRQVFLTLAAAALPASGTLVVVLYFSLD